MKRKMVVVLLLLVTFLLTPHAHAKSNFLTNPGAESGTSGWTETHEDETKAVTEVTKDGLTVEWEFITEIAQQSDCLLLLDINNTFVSAFNHSFDPLVYLNGLPVDKVKQIHLAGYTDNQDYLIDTHDQPVSAPAWELYEQALKQFGSVPTMIERDDNFPAFNDLLIELEQARTIDRTLNDHLRSYVA